MRRALSALLIVVVAAFAMAGCGGGDSAKPTSKADYKKTYAPLSVEIRGLGVVAGTALQNAKGQTSAAVASTFAALGKQADSIAKKLDAAAPPEDATLRKHHDALVAGLKEQAADLKAISAAVKKGDKTATNAAVKKLVADAKSVSEPQAALVKALEAKN